VKSSCTWFGKYTRRDQFFGVS